jgi:hypothetical protein
LEEPFAFLAVSPTGTILYRMLETSTESTIQKLLTRGKFNQAADLAEQYGKDLDIVYKAKARSKFNELMGMGDEIKAASIFQELIETLEKINDANFVCDFCSQKGFYSLNWIRRLLSVGKGRVKHCSNSSAGKNLLLTIKKLYTFEQVFPHGGIQDWLDFVSDKNSMFQQCKWFLNKVKFTEMTRKSCF